MTHGDSIRKRNEITQAIGDEFGAMEYQRAMRDMHSATCDAAGIARHGYELAFAKQRLADLRAAK